MVRKLKTKKLFSQTHLRVLKHSKTQYKNDGMSLGAVLEVVAIDKTLIIEYLLKLCNINTTNHVHGSEYCDTHIHQNHGEKEFKVS